MIKLAFWIYIIKSETTSKIYIGHTSDLERRLREHNDRKVGKRRYTRKQQGPWHFIHFEEMDSRSEAMRREKFLKSGKGREWIYKNIIPR